MANFLEQWPWNVQGLWTVLLYIGLPFLLASLGLLYILLRQGDARSDRHDPHLGMKSALHFFFSVALLILLTGLAILADDLAATDTELFSGRQRTGVALVIAGTLFSSLHWLLLRFGTNEAAWPAPRRMFTGWRFAIHGFVVLIAATLLLMELFQRPQQRTDIYRTYFAVLCVWAPSWLIHLVLLWWYSAKTDTARPAVSWDTDND
jgi:hypothetical protein